MKKLCFGISFESCFLVNVVVQYALKYQSGANKSIKNNSLQCFTSSPVWYGYGIFIKK